MIGEIACDVFGCGGEGTSPRQEMPQIALYARRVFGAVAAVMNSRILGSVQPKSESGLLATALAARRGIGRDKWVLSEVIAGTGMPLFSVIEQLASLAAQFEIGSGPAAALL